MWSVSPSRQLFRETNRNAMDTRVPQWTPYCGDAPEPTHWLVHWNFDPVLMAATFCLLVLGICRSPSTVRNQAAAAAIVLILFVSPLCALGSALFSIRAAHHLALALVLAPVLAGALPDHTRFRPPLAAATIVQAALLWVWHVPAFYVARFRMMRCSGRCRYQSLQAR